MAIPRVAFVSKKESLSSGGAENKFQDVPLAVHIHGQVPGRDCSRAYLSVMAPDRVLAFHRNVSE